MNWIWKMLKQPSTYRGASLILGAIGVSISPELADKIGLLVIAALGVIETVRDERKPATAPQVQAIVDDREPVQEVNCADTRTTGQAQRISSPEAGRTPEDAV